MLGMRTTLTLDDALFRDLKDLAHKTDAPFKDVVEKVIRAGLANVKHASRPAPYRVPTFSMGRPRGVNLDKALALAGEQDDEESLRKMALRK